MKCDMCGYVNTLMHLAISLTGTHYFVNVVLKLIICDYIDDNEAVICICSELFTAKD